MLAPGTGNRMLVDQALSGLPRQPAWSCEVRHVPALLSLIEAGLGIGAVPRFAVSSSGSSALACVPLVEPTVTRTLGIIRRRGRPLTPAAQALHELLMRPARPRRAARRGDATKGARKG